MKPVQKRLLLREEDVADDMDAVRGVILPTWVSAVAISMYARVPHKKALEILKALKNAGHVEMRDCRLDGHNPVWMVRCKGQDTATN